MPVPHLEIRIVQRSKGSSAVAGAAYQAGEKRRKRTRAKTLDGDKGAIIHHLKMVIAFYRKPLLGA